MLCITVAFSAVCFFPLDVANAGGSLDCGDANGNCGGISFTWIWYILFVIIEKIRGKRVDANIEGWFHTIGFLLLMLLMILITIKDIIGLF